MVKSDPNIMVWSEWTEPESVYPNGIHGAISSMLNNAGFNTFTASMRDSDQGLSESLLSQADTLFWFAHKFHDDISQNAVEQVVYHVKERGMGFIPLHSAHLCKPFRKLMGTKCTFPSWDENAGTEYIKVVLPEHPIAQGINDFNLPETEMYSEPFDVPDPDEVVFQSSWDGGEWFRSGCCWCRGKGRIFYFRPGHETYPIFFNKTVQKILINAVFWTVS